VNAPPSLALDLDGVIGDTRPLWRDWLTETARRLAPIAPLDTEALPDDRGEAAAELDRWAGEGIGDWRSALERYAADRAPVYLRPDAGTSAALRRLQAAGARIGVFTDAPAPLARVALAHLGAARRVVAVEAGPDALERLLDVLGAGAVVVRSREELERLP
jgi:phosphoglycolate phosphatase-like HAD superfamily hydrolase